MDRSITSNCPLEIMRACGVFYGMWKISTTQRNPLAGQSCFAQISDKTVGCVSPKDLGISDKSTSSMLRCVCVCVSSCVHMYM